MSCEVGAHINMWQKITRPVQNSVQNLFATIWSSREFLLRNFAIFTVLQVSFCKKFLFHEFMKKIFVISCFVRHPRKQNPVECVLLYVSGFFLLLIKSRGWVSLWEVCAVPVVEFGHFRMGHRIRYRLHSLPRMDLQKHKNYSS